MVTRSSPRFTSLITVVAFLFFASLFPQFGLGPAAAYSCGTTYQNHCYNIVTWLGITPGTRTSIYSRAMSVFGGSSTDFITAETWLIDNQSPQCTATFLQGCWIEAGFLASASSGGVPRIFVEIIDPSGNFISYPYTTIAYPQNSWTTFTIFSYNADQNFTVLVDNDQYNIHLQQPLTNNMLPRRIETGQELAGASNTASSQQIDWLYNLYAGNQGTFYYQFTDGQLWAGPRNPPFGNWASPPSQGQYPGGWFYSYCC